MTGLGFKPRSLVTPEISEFEKVKKNVNTVLTFFEGLMDNRPFFASNDITLADSVAGTVVVLMPLIGVSLDDFPKIKAWCDRLMSRPSWQQTQFTEAQMAVFATRREKFLAKSEV
ncbi:MAG: glutathione S-transferase family protein [Microcoleus sp.]|uniref:glutathione S-transferase family protein n=1 Tax=Microcoleus sp. TaxID=44472 RepID=UPI003C778763